MFYPLLSLHALGQCDARDTQVLTANNRLTVFLKAMLRQQSTQAIVALPMISPYKAWLNQQAEQLLFSRETYPLLLNEMAEQWYWQKALQQEGERLLNPVATSAMARKAHHLQAEWAIQVQDHEMNPEYTLFLQWQARYNDELTRLGAWDSPRLAEEIIQAIQHKTLAVPKTLVLLGFYSLSDYQQKLFQALQDQGTQIYTLDLARQPASTLKVYAFDEANEELETALVWAKNYHQSLPNHRLAIVVPTLESEAARVSRMVAKVLKDSTMVAHLAVGRSLKDWRLIRSMTKWLGLLVSFQRGVLPVSELGAVLLEADCMPQYREAFANWDKALREESRMTTVSVAMWLSALKKIDETLAIALEHYLAEFGTKKTCADWAQLYREVVSIFPYHDQVDSVNYQLCRSFEHALTKFSMMDDMLPALGASEAWQLWEQQLQGTTFQVQRSAKTTLDIVGLYELEGGQWDAVWVLGLNDTVLPKAPRPNPYLPVSSQRRHGVTRASVESEMQWAQQLFQAAKHCATTLIFSWAKHEKGNLLRHSPLLNPYLEQQEIFEKSMRSVTLPVVLETLEDNKGLPIQGTIKGGYGLLDAQSKCPLWGYGQYRLHLQALPDYPVQLWDKSLSGTVVHRALEKVYQQLPTQAHLDDEQGLTRSVVKALKETREELLGYLPSKALKKMQMRRLFHLIRAFLIKERNERCPFEIHALEQKVELGHAGVQLSLKIDRIDKVRNDLYFFFDYKTSLQSQSQCKEAWQERERLINVQLPLYASSLSHIPQEKVAGMSFAVLVNKEKHEYVGLYKTQPCADAKAVLNAEEWSSLQVRWQAQIMNLFEEIAQGEASNVCVDDKDLMYCRIPSFLRRYDSQGEQDE